jgi:hypothetical protein
VHKILVAAYHMLARDLGYRELGGAYLDQLDKTQTVANLKRRIERLGYQPRMRSHTALRDQTYFRGRGSTRRITGPAVTNPRIRA